MQTTMRRKAVKPFAGLISKVTGQPEIKFDSWNQKIVMYCDLEGKYRNKRFQFNVKNIVESFNRLEQFRNNNNHIRSARHYIENSDTGEVQYYDINF